jgi:hypothetical protein
VDTTRSTPRTPRATAAYHAEQQQLAQLQAQTSQQMIGSSTGHQQAMRSSLGPTQLVQIQQQQMNVQPHSGMMEVDHPSLQQQAQQQAHMQQQLQQHHVAQAQQQYQSGMRGVAAAPPAAGGAPRSSDIGGLKMDQALQQSSHSHVVQLGSALHMQVRQLTVWLPTTMLL